MIRGRSIGALIDRMDARAAERERLMDERAAEREFLMDERAANRERAAAVRERLMDARAAERDRVFLERMKSSEQHFIEALAENSAEIKAMGETRAEDSERMWKSLDDMRESIQANTRAVLSVLDRLDGSEGLGSNPA